MLVYVLCTSYRETAEQWELSGKKSITTIRANRGELLLHTIKNNNICHTFIYVEPDNTHFTSPFCDFCKDVVINNFL